jgi:hypothetical protein
MKLFIKLTGILGLLIFTNCSKEEDVILSGNNNQTTQNNIFYQEFSVDTTNNGNDTILYDIDGDFNLDFELIKTIVITSQTVSYSGSIKSLTDTVEFIYLKNSPVMGFVELGDNISYSTTYTWYNEVLYSGSTPFISANHYWADGAFTDYFGFQLTRNGTKHYGWFQLKHFQIQELGFNKTSNESILVGQKE